MTEAERIAKKIAEIKQLGEGSVTIKIQNGKIKRILKTDVEEFGDTRA